MRQIKADTQAAEYVLGTLDLEARRHFAEQISDDPSLQELVDAWEQRLGALEHGVTPVDPPAGLWKKIEAAVNEAPAKPPFGITMRENEGQWEVVLEGVEKKLLFTDPAAGTESYLLRVAPRTRVPAHHHERAEECLVLEGDLFIGDLRLAAGDYHLALPGSDHPDAWTESGTLVYIRGDIQALAS